MVAKSAGRWAEPRAVWSVAESVAATVGSMAAPKGWQMAGSSAGAKAVRSAGRMAAKSVALRAERSVEKSADWKAARMAAPLVDLSENC